MTDETNEEIKASLKIVQDNSKIVDFKRRKQEKQEQEAGESSTKYDFTLDDTNYKLLVGVYENGIALVYVHEAIHQIGPLRAQGVCRHNEDFIELNKWEKFLNYIGANIQVEDKIDRLLPKYKEETLKQLNTQKDLRERQEALEEKLK